MCSVAASLLPPAGGTCSAPSAEASTATSTGLHRQVHLQRYCTLIPAPRMPSARYLAVLANLPNKVLRSRCCSSATTNSAKNTKASRLLRLLRPLRPSQLFPTTFPILSPLPPLLPRQSRFDRLPTISNTYIAELRCRLFFSKFSFKCSSADVHDTWLLPALPLGRPQDQPECRREPHLRRSPIRHDGAAKQLCRAASLAS